MARHPRIEEHTECKAVGVAPRHMIFALWRCSCYSRSAFLDGEPIAVWGDAAPILSREAHAWLFTAPAIERVPMTFFRQAKREIATMLEARERLRTSVVAASERSLRFWRMLGATIEEPDARGLSNICIERR